MWDHVQRHHHTIQERVRGQRQSHQNDHNRQGRVDRCLEFDPHIKELAQVIICCSLPVSDDLPVPCIPQLSNVEIDCLANSAWVMFEESNGAQEYIVTATDSLGDTQMYVCNFTEDGVCSLPPLACSKNLTFTLKAADQQCSSAPSNAITVETGELL